MRTSYPPVATIGHRLAVGIMGWVPDRIMPDGTYRLRGPVQVIRLYGRRVAVCLN